MAAGGAAGGPRHVLRGPAGGGWTPHCRAWRGGVDPDMNCGAPRGAGEDSPPSARKADVPIGRGQQRTLTRGFSSDDPMFVTLQEARQRGEGFLAEGLPESGDPSVVRFPGGAPDPDETLAPHTPALRSEKGGLRVRTARGAWVRPKGRQEAAGLGGGTSHEKVTIR